MGCRDLDSQYDLLGHFLFRKNPVSIDNGG
jgi:hypothetical protein